ncbi:hypothetical protein [Brevibacillus laterosporus]|uniref:hypothetical protein n=1 Tax=Brevibacillus laterosporus TaxID=1465 RepID=UPI002E1D66DD|nr:hypothetical protein [Brevibacillus laterosporus]MED1667173.1 hypothetical protein [Brevibacillus laterosporus]MED1719759.1 hypothetical protein [Brevibacillus laterosporus]
MLTYTVEKFTGSDYELVFSSANREIAYGLEADCFEDANFLAVKTWKDGVIINTDILNEDK